MSLPAPIYPWLSDVWARYVKARLHNKMPHAVLICGYAGLGKHQLAQQIIASLLCEQPDEEAFACGQCHSCQLFAASTHPDHVLVAAEAPGKAISVDQIRDLWEKQTLKAKLSTQKTALISAADRLNISAYNCLLKLLEEPQPDTVLILLSQNSRQLPATIKSRCQLLHIAVPEHEIAMQWLAEQLPKLSESQRGRLLMFCQGAPLLALNQHRSGAHDIEQLEKDFESLLNAQANPVKLAAQWQQYDLELIFYYLQTLVRNRLTTQLINHTENNQPEIVRLWSIADYIVNTIKLLSTANNLNNILLIEDFMVSVIEICSINNINRLHSNR